MSETVNDCQLIQCTVTSDVEIYSLETLLPQNVVVPVVEPTYGNTEVYWQCGGAGTIILNTTLPSWITLDTVNNRLVGRANTFRDSTISAATTTAQTELDNWSNAAFASGDILCYTAGLISLQTLVLVNCDVPWQSAYDPVFKRIWTTYNTTGPTFYIPVIQTKQPPFSDVLLTQIGDTVQPYGISYVPDLHGTLQTDRMFVRQGDTLLSYHTTTFVKSTVVAGLFLGAGGTPGQNLYAPNQKLLLSYDRQPATANGHSSIFYMLDGSYVTWTTAIAPAPSRMARFALNEVDDTGIIVKNGQIGGIRFSDFGDLGLFNYGGTAVDMNHACYCPDNYQLYITVTAPGGVYYVHIYNAFTRTYITRVALGASLPVDIVYHAARQCMYIVCQNGTVYIMQISDNSIVTTAIGVTVSAASAAAIYCPYSTKVYIPCQNAMKILT